jgi:hypothetical protein
MIIPVEFSALASTLGGVAEIVKSATTGDEPIRTSPHRERTPSGNATMTDDDR